MALLNQLQQQGSVYTAYNGATPLTPVDATDQSTLHDEYSLTGTPNIPGKPTPSVLDLDGVTPPTYRDNSPEGASF